MFEDIENIDKKTLILADKLCKELRIQKLKVTTDLNREQRIFFELTFMEVFFFDFAFQFIPVKDKATAKDFLKISQKVIVEMWKEMSKKAMLMVMKDEKRELIKKRKRSKDDE